MTPSGSRIVLLGLLVGAVLGAVSAHAQALRIGQPAPEITGPRWINSGPLAMERLRGRVVAVEFWTYG